MKTDFVLFGWSHCAILASVPAAAAWLTWLARTRPGCTHPVRLVAAWFLLVNELVWYGYRLCTEGWRFPEGLPLQFCDLALWVTIIGALTLRPLSTELAYYFGVAGSTQALLTPELWAPMRSYPTIYFFVAHGGIAALALFLVWSGLAKPRPGSVWRAFAATNAFGAVVALFNLVFRTNYMYLCRKPSSASLLDYLGPWPLYILAGEFLALGLFAVLWWPFRIREASR